MGMVRTIIKNALTYSNSGGEYALSNTGQNHSQ
jgi:hypothetical protein